MASLTLKDIPDTLLQRLRERATSDRRSLTQEILHLLEEALAGRAPGSAAREEEARAQVAALSELAGRWRSEGGPAQEIAEALESYTGASMKRTVIHLDKELDVWVNLEATRTGQSVAEIFRDALRSFLRQRPGGAPPGRGAFASGRSDTAERSEEHLAETGFGRD